MFLLDIGVICCMGVVEIFVFIYNQVIYEFISFLDKNGVKLMCFVDVVFFQFFMYILYVFIDLEYKKMIDLVVWYLGFNCY